MTFFELKKNAKKSLSRPWKIVKFLSQLNKNSKKKKFCDPNIRRIYFQCLREKNRCNILRNITLLNDRFKEYIHPCFSPKRNVSREFPLRSVSSGTVNHDLHDKVAWIVSNRSCWHLVPSRSSLEGRETKMPTKRPPRTSSFPSCWQCSYLQLGQTHGNTFATGSRSTRNIPRTSVKPGNNAILPLDRIQSFGNNYHDP